MQLADNWDYDKFVILNSVFFNCMLQYYTDTRTPVVLRQSCIYIFNLIIYLSYM